MTKPISASASAPVRSRPKVSIDKRRGEVQNPPAIPPQRVALDLDPIPLEVRRLRVAHGSRRKRDLAAVEMAEELERLERFATAEALDCRAVLRGWVGARRQLRHALPPSTYALWIRPLRPVGADHSTLLLSAPENVAAWAERRYSRLITEALEGTDFEMVEFVSEGDRR